MTHKQKNTDLCAETQSDLRLCMLMKSVVYIPLFYYSYEENYKVCALLQKKKMIHVNIIFKTWL